MGTALDTQLAYLKAHPPRLWPGAAQDRTPAPKLSVSVLQGLHAGSMTLVEGSTLVIGDDPEHDIMLLDDAFDGISLRVTVERSILGSFVTFDGTTQVAQVNGAPANGAPEKLPCEVSVGDVTLRIADPSIQAKRRRGPLLGAIAVGAVAFIGTGIALGSSQAPSKAPMRVLVAAEAATVPAVAAADTKSAKDWLVEQTRDAGLADSLTFTWRGVGALAVVGSLNAKDMTSWRRIHSEFDARAFPEVLLTEITLVPTLPTVPAIATVRLGTAPALVLAGGDELTIGQSIGDGWTLQDITLEGMVVRRRNEDLTINY